MKRASTVSCAAIFVILLLSVSTTMSGAANSSAPGVSYMNLRFASFKAPPGPLSTVNDIDVTPDPAPYTAAPILRGDGINGIRFDGMSWSQYDILGVSGWQNAVNYEAAAFDQQGISIVWGLPILDDIRAVPCDLLFYAESSTPGTSQVPNFCGFGGSGSNPAIQAQAVALFESDATYWGRTTNTQYTAANGTVVPAGFYHWSYASQYSGLPVWQA